MNQASSNNKTAPNIDVTLIKALCSPSIYDHEVASISVIETHISWVLLTGQFAYKIKKPVNFGFLDFSTLQKRRFFCQEELRLNRRLTPNLYLDVVSITGSQDHPQIGGSGAAIEYAVKMAQFPAGQTLNTHAEQRQLTHDEIDQLVGIVADFHDAIEKAVESSPYGEPEDIKHWFVENFDHIRPLLDEPNDKQQLQAIQSWGNNEWHKRCELMQLRRQRGYIRECHGDLHLGNMTLIDGKVTLFDCIEFNPMLRWIDVLSEVAFLFIDLLHFNYEAYAHRFLNQYLQRSGDYQGLVLFRYYLVYRALVRAKVSLLRLTQQPDEAAICQQARSDYAIYATLAERFTKEARPILIITHGFSGSGKSTLSSQLAEKIGALQIRSDIERKRLFGYRAQEHTHSGLNNGLYTEEIGLKTYQRLAELAKATLEAGFTAIVDATFLKLEQRDLLKQLAAKVGVPFFIIDFQAPNEALRQRLQQRQHDASEATIDVLHQQQQSAQAFMPEEHTVVIAVDTESPDAVESLLANLESGLATISY